MALQNPKKTRRHIFGFFYENAFNGAYPYGGVMQGADGNLYGTTNDGGKGAYGTLFKCTLGGILTDIANFNDTNGGNPYGTLVQASTGNIYGMTSYGGSGKGGTVFEYTPGGAMKILVDFSNNENPYGGLVIVNDSLYGMTRAGGTAGSGRIFKCDTLGNTIVSLVNFSSGENPFGNLLLAADGKLYGMTHGGGVSGSGTVFQCTTTGTLTTLVTFSHGENPYGTLIQATNGDLYGITYGGGVYNTGSIFQCTTTGTLTTISSLRGANGYSQGSLMQATNGNLYGMSNSAASEGSVFTCSTSGTLTTLYYMGSTDMGSTPEGSLAQANDGNLYGMSQYGGLFGSGTLFSVSPVTGVMKNVINFNDSNGSAPLGTLVQAKDGFLYGMTSLGGKYNMGTLFKFSTSTGKLVILVSFNDTNGASPYGKLMVGKDSALYGMTREGGIDNYGVIFRYYKNTMTTLYSFANKEYPKGNLIQATDGNLYGMAGNNASGYIFQYAFQGSTLNSVYAFSKSEYPTGSLIEGADSNLYGMTYGGGTAGDGYIFKSTLGGTLTNLYSFTGAANGQNPGGSLIQATDSSLYGMTFSGGKYGVGTMFSTTTKGAFDTLFSFSNSNGANPMYGDLMEQMTVTLASNVICPKPTLMAVDTGGGLGSYSYKWSTGATTSSITNATTSGTYTVTVTNANGLSLTKSISSPVFTDMTVSTHKVTNASCTNCTDGSAVVWVSGGHKNTMMWTDSTGLGYVVIGNHTADTINNLGAGTYVITITDSCGNSKTDTVRIKQPAPLGIQPLSVSNGVLIYPMPTNGRFTMAMAGDGYQLINIYDEAGSKIYSSELSDRHSNGSMAIDLSAYANGIYFAQVITTHGTINKKIVIQK